MKEELKEYYCLNDYIMECVELKGEAAFLEGKKYLFNNEMIAKSELFGEHDLSDEIDFDKHFILQSEWDLLQQKSIEIPKQQLIGMTAFVLEQYKLFIQDKITSEQFRNNVWNYANFLSRQPQLSDFVACGKDGLPIEEPKHVPISTATDEEWKQYCLDLKNYQQALDKVLFKGFQWNSKGYAYKDDLMIDEEFIENLTIESLTSYNLELTDNANKIIGG